MRTSLPGSRTSRWARFILAVVLLLALVGGIGAPVAADGDSGRACPDDNPTKAFEHASETAFEKSAEGRTTALQATGCIP